MIKTTTISRMMAERAPLAAKAYTGRFSDAEMGASVPRLDQIDNAVLATKSVSAIDLMAKFQILMDRIDDPFEMKQLFGKKELLQQLWADVVVEIGTADPEAAEMLSTTKLVSSRERAQ